MARSRGARATVCTILLAAMLIAVGVAGCSGASHGAGEAVAPSSASSPGVGDSAAIYSLVVRRICANDPEVGKVAKPTVYLVRRLDDGVGSGSTPAETPAALPADVQTGISAALSDMKSTVKWVDTFGAVQLDGNTGAVVGGGVIVQVGAIKSTSAGKVEVPAGIYAGNLGASGRTYVLEKAGEVWKITGTTGVEWMS